MSSDSVTDAIAAWFAPPAVVGLNRVFDSAPWFDSGADFELDSELGWGALGFVWVDQTFEQRIALGGAHGGMKLVSHQCSLVILFQWIVPTNQDQDYAKTGYRKPLNTVLDGARARLRQDRTLGVNGLGVFQAGEGLGQPGSTDIQVSRDLPKRDNGRKVWSWNQMQFVVQEVVAT